MALRHFLSSGDVSVSEQSALIARAIELKKKRGAHPRSLEGRSVGMIFEKPSTRTRVSFEVAVAELGGHPLILRMDELQLGRGETVEDTARVLSRYLHAIVIRTFAQDKLEQLASESKVPVVNALSDFEHPCQALADVMTAIEKIGNPKEVRMTYIGDGNNVCHSLLIAAAKAGFARVEVASPPGYEPVEAVVERAAEIGLETGSEVENGTDPVKAAKGANVIYTDVWASMGQEQEREARLTAFEGFSITSQLLSEAAPDVIVMHCLPAHRGEEISADVIDGPASVVWEQAENRLHVQKALLEWLMGPA